MGLLRRIAPDVKIIVGGPEVRWAQEPLRDADVLIRGEAEVTFPLVCADLLAGLEVPALLDAQQPELEELNLPYERIIAMKTSLIASSQWKHPEAVLSDASSACHRGRKR